MDLSHVTFLGPDVDDHALLEDLPGSLKSLLSSVNGFIQFGGGLHLRGACLGPDWHSLRRAWRGDGAFHTLYAAVKAEWIPFAEDCVGDQFLLAGDKVLRLSAETGEVTSLDMGLRAFLEAANADPVGFLSMEPLMRARQDQGDMQAGHLLLAYPPFCSRQAAEGVSLKALPAWEVHGFHARLAARLPADGQALRMDITD